MECCFLLQGVFPDQGSNLQFLPALAGRFLTTVLPRKPYHSLIPLLGIYPKKMKTLIQKDICTPTFIAALFTTAKIWKQPKCPSISERLKKMCYICTVEYCVLSHSVMSDSRDPMDCSLLGSSVRGIQIGRASCRERV